MADVPDDIAQLLSSIMLNWSMVDNFSGAILADLYGIQNNEDASELVHAIDLRKKLDFIEKARKRGKIESNLYPACDALKFANANFRKNRNIVAHSMLMDAWDGQEHSLLSLNGLQQLSRCDFDLVLEQSRYTMAAVKMLLTGCVSVLPPRPSALPSSA